MSVRQDSRSTMFGLAGHAGLYHRLTRRIFGRLHARVVADVAAAHPSGKARVLDAGTGLGRLPLAIADAVPHLRIDGIDLSPSMIDAARQACDDSGCDQVTFAVADVTALPFPDATFDLIVSTMSLHHWTAPQAAVRELRRVLRPTGQVWIYDVQLALRRGLAAARTAAPSSAVRREPVRTGRLPLRLFGRLVIDHSAVP